MNDVIDLTVRETEVLRLYAEGLTAKEVGARLFLSDKTVKQHAQNIRDKFVVPNMVAACVKAVRQGVI